MLIVPSTVEILFTNDASRPRSCRHRNRHCGQVRRGRPIAGPVDKGVRANKTSVGPIGERAVGFEREGALGRSRHQRGREGLPLRVAVVGQDITFGKFDEFKIVV